MDNYSIVQEHEFSYMIVLCAKCHRNNVSVSGHPHAVPFAGRWKGATPRIVSVRAGVGEPVGCLFRLLRWNAQVGQSRQAGAVPQSLRAG